jgi:hypothetical protein
MLRRLPEAKDFEHREGNGIFCVVEDLLGAKGIDSIRHRREREDELVSGEARLDTGGVERGSTREAGGLEAFDLPGREGGGMDEPWD